MAISINLTDDGATFDGSEAIGLASIVNGAAAANVNVPGALRQGVDRQAAQLVAAGLAVEPGDVTFHIPAGQLGGIEPKPGDVITDVGGNAYTVLSVAKETFGTRWACVCRQRRV